MCCLMDPFHPRDFKCFWVKNVSNPNWAPVAKYWDPQPHKNQPGGLTERLWSNTKGFAWYDSTTNRWLTLCIAAWTRRHYANQAVQKYSEQSCILFLGCNASDMEPTGATPVRSSRTQCAHHSIRCSCKQGCNFKHWKPQDTRRERHLVKD